MASHIKVHRDEVILSHKAMGGAMRALADVWWWWFRDQKPFGRDKDRPHHFYKWLGDKRLTRMLPTDYAGATPSEAFPEILASLVLRYHGWKTGMGRSIGDQSTHPFIAAVVRTVLRPVQREDEEDVGLEGGPDVIVLGERKVEDAVRRFYGGAAHAR
ncbi:MAG: hypothetical protein GWN97_05960, partial [Thermoplasmata archaeon]|nr:hypothetical protein [Thermoplasmata archaeon]NIT76514.1 hypothetical protein [Thermoplasmata archaeon]NIY02885.1 hypothetical protein [Thermoplasmata archaeon]